MYKKSKKYMFMGRVSYIISAALMIAALVTNVLPPPAAHADNGAIWTTAGTCGSPQDENQYVTGDHILIHGSGFDAGTYAWSITHTGGGNTPVQSGNYTVDATGTFCFDAYTVQPSDSGEYQVKFGVKGDNYQVAQLPAASASVVAGACSWTEAGGSSTAVVITLVGASLTINNVTYTSSTTIYLPPGAYPYSWAALTGYAGSGTGSITIGDCTPTPNYTLGLTKTDNLNPTHYDHVGQVVTYTLTATNNGNRTLHNVSVSDNPSLGSFACTPSIPVAALAVGASIVCTGTHSITQGDLDAGSFTDTGSATSTEATAPNASDTVTGTKNPVLTLTKTDGLNPGKFDHVNQVVTYTLTATNTGNVTLHNVSVSDNPALDGFSCNPAILSSLAPGDSMVCTGTHSISLVDLDAGRFDDTASATSTEAAAPNATDTVFASTYPVLSLTKTDSLNSAKYDHVGQVVTYTLTATNESNITLHNVMVSDAPALDSFSCNPAVAAASLAPGASIVCTGTHSITQGDLDAGLFKDTASAESNEITAPDASDTIYATSNAVLSLTKVDDLNPLKYDHVGQVVTYTLTATNSGNVTLHNVVVSDNPVLAGFGCTPSNGATLAVGESIVCKGSHSITQADLDSGSYVDTASASSTEVSATDAKDTVNGTQNAVLSLTKTDGLNGAKYDHVGQVISYTLTATNSGNVTLHNVSVSDNPALAGFICNPSIPAASLAPGESIACTGTHSITQTDLNTGTFLDTASATSTEDNAPDAPDIVLGIQNASLSLTKVATEANFNAAGVTLHYTLVATNTGNVTLTGVSITDAKLGTLACTPTQPATLVPGAALSCTGTYLTTQPDVDAGKVDNTANAGGSFGTAPVLAAPASASVPAVGAAHLSLTKVVTETSFNGVGVTLHYTLVATNDGDKTLTSVSITDTKLGTLACTPTQPATLAPAEKLTCTGTYLTTQLDVDAGKVDNTANASGSFGGNPVAALPASATVPGLMNPHLSLTKVATETSFDAAGVTLHYTLVATNDGNVTLTGVSILDPKLGTLTCVPAQPATLAPAAALSCTGTYLTTAADMNAGKVDNTANAGGMYGQAPVNADPASASVPAFITPPPTPVPGCTDPTALNYNPKATVNDGSCIYGGGGGATILIPVTGVDTGLLGRTLPGSLFGLSFGFAGLGLVFSGLGRRRED